MLNLIKKYLSKRREKKANTQAKVDQVIMNYDFLIAQYRLVQEKRSPLSRREREIVVDSINKAVALGHIKVAE